MQKIYDRIASKRGDINGFTKFRKIDFKDNGWRIVIIPWDG